MSPLIRIRISANVFNLFNIARAGNIFMEAVGVESEMKTCASFMQVYE